MVMRVDQPAERPIADSLLRRGDEALRVQRRAGGVDDHRVVVADDEPRIRHALRDEAWTTRLDVGEHAGCELAQLVLPARHRRKSWIRRRRCGRDDLRDGRRGRAAHRCCGAERRRGDATDSSTPRDSIGGHVMLHSVRLKPDTT
jgi:hypothetical protein